MKPNSTASYGHVHLRSIDDHVRINFECRERSAYRNSMGHDVERTRLAATVTDSDDNNVVETHIVVVCLDKRDYLRTLRDDYDGCTPSHVTPYEVLVRETNETWNWDDAETIAQYSSSHPVSLTGAICRLLEDAHEWVRPEAR